MRTIIIMTSIILASSTMPAAAQAWLGPLQDFVEDLVPEQEEVRPAPAPATEQPPVPRPRPPGLPDGPVVVEPSPPSVAPVAAPPEARDAPEDAASEAGPEPVVPVPAPEPLPERVYQVACPAVLLGLVAATMADPLSEGACGEQSPLLVTGVLANGRMVPLSSAITTNCQMATALPRWVETVDGYAGAMLGSALASVDTGTSYMCRNRNNAGSGFTSEHGFANALDVTGFTLADGRRIAVEGDWLPAAAPEGRLLRLAHDAACAGFTTVLGPEANAEHADHLHLDLGCHGQTCTAKVCE